MKLFAATRSCYLVVLLVALLLCSSMTMASMTKNEALKVLGLSGFNYSEKVLKDAYKKKALESHPDKGGSSTQFIRVAEAYEILSGKGGRKSSFGSDGDNNNNAKSREEQMNQAEDMFFEMFEDMFGENGELKIIDKLFDEYLDKQKQTWMLKLIKSGVKWAAGWLVSAMESDNASITINGETMKGSEFKKWRDEKRERLKKRQERIHSDL